MEKKTTRNSNVFDRVARRPPAWIRWGLYAGLTAGFLSADHYTGLKIFFPLSFAVPVLLASWWDGRWAGYTLATISLIPWTHAHAIADLVIRALALVFLVELICRTADLAKRVRILEGLLPICSFCHRIRAEEHQWFRLEKYIHERADVIFSHGLCPDCLESHYGMEYDELMRESRISQEESEKYKEELR